MADLGTCCVCGDPGDDGEFPCGDCMSVARAFVALGTAIARFCREREVADLCETLRACVLDVSVGWNTSELLRVHHTALNRLATLALEPTGGRG